MIEARRRAYLGAMDIDVWLQRPQPAEPDHLLLGPGQGSTLLICAQPAAGAGKLAGDLSRAVGQDPVWAWPDPDDAPAGPRLQEAVEVRLFTRVVIFGRSLASRLFRGDVPGVLVSAAVVVAPDLEELAVRGTAKQAFWRQLQASSHERSA